MLDRVKSLVSTLKDILVFIVLPVAGLIAYIIHLQNKVKGLSADISQSKAEAELGKTLLKVEEANKEAKDAEANYHYIRDTYLQHDSSDTDV